VIVVALCIMIDECELIVELVEAEFKFIYMTS